MISRLNFVILVVVFCRGFYPRGGGEVVLRGNPIKFIKPVELLDVGQIRRIVGLSFVAGTLPIKVGFVAGETPYMTFVPI